LLRADCPGGGYLVETEFGDFKGNFVFADNFVSLGHGSLQAFNSPSPNYLGWCGMQKAVDSAAGGTYLLSKNILSGVDQGITNVTTGSGPCVQQNRFPADHTFFNDTYTNKFQDTSSSDFTKWDYHCKSSFTACKNGATDGKDIGANIDLLNWATGNVESGAPNPFFNFMVKPALTSRDTAILGYTAPTTEACTVVVSVNQNYSSPVLNQTDMGGDPARSVTVTGLIPVTYYYEKVTCGAAQYLLERTFQTTP
jgi:hypothetical protein